jgi:hypothetical protein
MAIGSKTLLNVAMLVTASVELSGCVYDGGLGYASNYYDDGYSCDPNGSYDAYYDCDYQQGFANTGFGGGWYDNYYYPGYGFYLFDNVGRRYPMREYHRRYWGEKRQGHFREQRSRDRDGRRYEGRDRSYSGGVEAMATERRDARRNQTDSRRGSEVEGASAVRNPSRATLQNTGAARDQVRGRNRVDGYGRRDRRIDSNADAARVRQQRVPQEADVQSAGVAPRAASAPRPERAVPVRRSGRNEGENVRDQ